MDPALRNEEQLDIRSVGEDDEYLGILLAPVLEEERRSKSCDEGWVREDIVRFASVVTAQVDGIPIRRPARSIRRRTRPRPGRRRTASAKRAITVPERVKFVELVILSVTPTQSLSRLDCVSLFSGVLLAVGLALPSDPKRCSLPRPLCHRILVAAPRSEPVFYGSVSLVSIRARGCRPVVTR
jgi:hypothetical protein